jgi:fumarate reductase subunit D
MREAHVRDADVDRSRSPRVAAPRPPEVRARRPWAPLLWAAFSAGGTIAALLYPVHLVFTGFAFPLGWLPLPGHEALLGLARRPISRVYLFVLIAVPLFHWAHRFRYTLYDGLQLKHLARPIAALCYGGALVGTVLAVYAIWRL